MVRILLFIGALSLLGCGSIMPETAEMPLSERLNIAKQIAHQGKLEAVLYQSENFKILTYQRISDPNAPLVIYLEGDGTPYIKRGKKTKDPTPNNPLALRLAAIDKAFNVLWVARPCQYSIEDQSVDQLIAGEMPALCESRYWTSARYASEIIEAVEWAIKSMLAHDGFSSIHLVGYDGGAAVALLLADRLNNIVSLRTIAGNLDPFALAKQQGQTPLDGSLNPIAGAKKLYDLPQIHFVGEEDAIMPDWVSKRYVDLYANPACNRILLIEDVEHEEGWTDFWQKANTKFPKC